MIGKLICDSKIISRLNPASIKQREVQNNKNTYKWVSPCDQKKKRSSSRIHFTSNTTRIHCKSGGHSFTRLKLKHATQYSVINNARAKKSIHLLFQIIKIPLWNRPINTRREQPSTRQPHFTSMTPNKRWNSWLRISMNGLNKHENTKLNK